MSRREPGPDIVQRIETELDRLDPPPVLPPETLEQPPPQTAPLPPPPGPVETGVARDLARLPDDMRWGGLASTALKLAAELDRGLGLTPRDAAGYARELRMCLVTLAEMAPGENKGDATDESRQRIARRFTVVPDAG
jgi:hypothetical protein